MEEELITIYAAYSREPQITPGEWRDKVLLPNLEKNWNDPNGLYCLIVSALNDGLQQTCCPQRSTWPQSICPISSRV